MDSILASIWQKSLSSPLYTVDNGSCSLIKWVGKSNP
jgi:hypothetical protein